MTAYRGRGLSFDPEISQHRGSLSVHAVFPHAWQLRSERREILSVVESRWNGPLTLRVAALVGKVAPGMTARLTEETLKIGTTMYSFAGATPWVVWGNGVEGLDVRLLADDLQMIGQWIEARAHPHPRLFSRGAGEGGRGWGGFAGSPTRGDATGAWADMGRNQLGALQEALVRRDGGAVSRHAFGLLGLGPGLTPAGDDVLCGVLAGLRVLGRRSEHHREQCEDMVVVLAEAIVASASRRTTSFSATLLRAATRGVVAEPLLRVLHTVGSGASVRGIDEVLMLGHSSGRDMLTGALMAGATLVRWEEVFGPAMVGSR
jgi:hypothetical protein